MLDCNTDIFLYSTSSAGSRLVLPKKKKQEENSFSGPGGDESVPDRFNENNPCLGNRTGRDRAGLGINHLVFKISAITPPSHNHCPHYHPSYTNYYYKPTVYRNYYIVLMYYIV